MNSCSIFYLSFFISKGPQNGPDNATPFRMPQLPLYETPDKKITNSSVNYEFNKEAINKSCLIYYDKGKQYCSAVRKEQGIRPNLKEILIIRLIIFNEISSLYKLKQKIQRFNY